ncbi:hypothetical protein F5Y01DRAFT_14172 [Xylaria sp. FL0043]|nr:hypothetical protein F5Y01DRAFT_14172 [Xylaria sp. FL0043]
MLKDLEGRSLFCFSPYFVASSEIEISLVLSSLLMLVLMKKALNTVSVCVLLFVSCDFMATSLLPWPMVKGSEVLSNA